MKKRTWTDEQLIEAYNSSRSIRQILIKLGLAPQGGSYKIIATHLNRLELDRNKLKGQGWSKGDKVTCNPAKKIEEILVLGSTYQTSKLRQRLISENIFDNICVECGVSEIYNYKPITLHLDHIDGNNTHNQINNLRLLCPNCHSQTETYCGKNKNKKTRPSGGIGDTRRS